MKRRTIINFFLIFGIVTSLWTISIVQAAPLAMDDKFESTMKMQWKFKDRFGFDYAEEMTNNINTVITGVDSTWVNYTEIQKINPYILSTLPPADNGEWSWAALNGGGVNTVNSEVNRTVNQNLPEGVQYVDFRWIDYPEWNNDTAGTEYQGWNDTLYSNRFSYFDMDSNVALDEFLLEIECPPFVDNATKLINIIKTQWNVYAYGFNVNNLPTVRWNRTAITWSSFKTSYLYQNIAYSTVLISNASTGNAEIFELTPQWVGQHHLPESYVRWNGTDWVTRYDMNDFADTDFSPARWNGTHYVLRDNYNYYASSTLNQRRASINGSTIFKNIKETFGANSFSIEFEVEIEDLDRFSYHTSANWTDKMRNNGTLDYTQKCQYHSEKGYIESSKLNKKYDFVDNGIYTEIVTLNPGSGGGVPGFEFPVLFFSLVLIALVIRRKKL